MRFRALAPFAFAVVGFVVAPAAHAAIPADPACDDHVKKPTDDAKKPPKAAVPVAGAPLRGDRPTDPSCDDDVKKPDDDEKPPKT
jgi:hypothetical protein